MKEEKDVKGLLKRFVMNRCSEQEIEEVIEYFRNRTDSSQFLTVEDVLDMLDNFPELDKASADRIYQGILTASADQYAGKTVLQRSKNSNWWRIAAAIAVVVAMMAGLLIWQNPFSSDETPSFSQVEDGVWVPDKEVITLTRENGQLEIINPDGSRVVTDVQGNVIGEQKKGILTYKGDVQSETLVYNTLTVPYGKRFALVLSDGTSVHLNAGSSLKYPVSFLKSENTREVFVTGEAYFDVSPDKDHPFIVNTGELDVEVLGTKFNVSTYPEDEAANVVLVEGSVHLQPEGVGSGGEAPVILEPGEKGRLDRSTNEITKRRVPVSIYIAWINGELVFRNMAFEDILKKLERRYNITIINQNESMAREKFNASFGDEPVEKVLNYMKTIYGIEFSIKDNKLIVQ